MKTPSVLCHNNHLRHEKLSPSWERTFEQVQELKDAEKLPVTITASGSRDGNALAACVCCQKPQCRLMLP